MVAPLVGLAGLYYAGKAVDSVRYWSDYYRNTGKLPKYPFRSGAVPVVFAKNPFRNVKRL